MLKLIKRILAILPIFGFLAPTCFSSAVAKEHKADAENILVIEVEFGSIVIELFPDVAPNHVERIKTLAREGFYDGIKFHRVIDGFMAQTGDPLSKTSENRGMWGTGGSDLPDLKQEFSDLPFERGTLGMARSAASTDTANSQFFICFTDSSFLNGQYTVFGKVIEGMHIVDLIPKGEPPAEPGVILSMSVRADTR